MRSRYTAYCTGNIDYLITTHHPSQRAIDERLQLRQSLQTTTWLGLTVLNRRLGQPSDPVGYVEFMAVYQSGNQVGQLHERSKFVQQQGQWLYLEGKILPPVTPKRHQPCWCGSGKIFKQCHGKP